MDHFPVNYHEISQLASLLWTRGWAERNAGNFSVRLDEPPPCAEVSDLIPCPGTGVFPARLTLAITAAGSRMRMMADDPQRAVLFIRLNEAGDHYRILWQEDQDRSLRPTSELSTHLSILQMLMQHRPESRAVLHAHVTELIALTHLPAFTTGEGLNRLLWGMHPEVATYLPDGAGLVPYTMPGTTAIAAITSSELQHHEAAVWEKHGMIATAASLMECFEQMDILAKAAGIYFMLYAGGRHPESGLSDHQIQHLRQPASD